MKQYTIKELEKLSGIKAHTIRIWESRYGIIKPSRTASNIRYYSDNDLKKILSIAILNKKGVKISKISALSEEDFNNEILSLNEISNDIETQMDTLTKAMIHLDEESFNNIITYYFETIGVNRTILEVIFPFLEKLSLMWLTGSVNQVQENFITLLIRQKIIVAIDKIRITPTKNSKKVFIYLPEGESQELILLLLHFLIKTNHHHVYYLGTNVHINDLKECYDKIKPNYILTFISESFVKQPVQKYIDLMAVVFSDSKILYSGYQVVSQEINMHSNQKVLYSLKDSIAFINHEL